MPIYDSDSEDQHAPSTKLFGRERPFHTILGRGKVADILLWKNKYLSAGILTGFSAVWLLFEAEEFHFIPLLCYILILLMFILCIWSNTSGFIKWRPPTVNDITLRESTFRSFFQRLNHLLFRFYDISRGKDLKTFLLTIAFLWILSSFGSLCNSTLTLLYIVFVGLSTLPVMCEKYEKQMNRSAGRINRDMKNLWNNFNSKVLVKIPRGPRK